MTKRSRAKKKGFTLIELMVVISIVAFLSSIIFASLNNARIKANDAKIISQLRSMKEQAALYTGVGTGYPGSGAGSCPTGTAADNTLFETANNGLGNLFTGMTILNTRCMSQDGKPSDGAAWAVAATLSNGAWCVDNRNVSRNTTAAGVPYASISSAIPVSGSSNFTCL